MPGFFAAAQNDSHGTVLCAIEREKAAIGALITLREPTKPMLTEAAAAGFYEARDFPGRYPQSPVTLSAAKSLFQFEIPRFFADPQNDKRGKKLEYPAHRVETFAKAERKTKHEQDELF